MYQLDIFNKTISERFAAFHAANPKVYVLFETFALQLLRSGHKKIGAKMIMEQVRWRYWTGSKDEQNFKINNNFISHYSRLFIKNHPQFDGCFEMRILKTV